MTNEIPGFDPEKDAVIRICSAVEDLDVPLGNSEKRTCADCGRQVWFDVSQSHGELDKYPTIVLCGQCGLVRIMAEGATVMNLTDQPFTVPSMDERIKELFSDEH